MTIPLVSILLPSFNHERFIEQSVRSALEQSYKNLELLIVDDGSTDATPDIIRGVIAEAPFPVRFETQANQGLAATLNRLLEMAKGEWIFLLSSDDYFFPQRITHCLDAVGMRTEQNPAAVHTNAKLVDDDGQSLGLLFPSSASAADGDQFENIATGHVRVAAPTLFARRENIEHVGGLDPTMIAEDLDFHLRLARLGPILFLPEPTMAVRHTAGSLGKQPWKWGDSIVRALEKHADRLGDRLPALLVKSSEDVAAACFAQGKPLVGLAWARRAVEYSAGNRARWATRTRVAKHAFWGATRFVLLSVFGRRRLVSWKRRLFPQPPTKSHSK